MDKYLDEKAVPQVSEILNNYGDIKILWWDTPTDMTPERAAKFFPEMEKHPNLIFNNRLGGGVEGDLETPEQYIPPTGIPGKNWESCMTMNDTWGFKTNDHNWKSSEMLVKNLIDIASKGGNYLLNVGPSSLGVIPDASVERLKEIGGWMKVNGEAIYGTSASPFSNLAWVRCTKKSDGNKEFLYFHVFDFPVDGKITLPGFSGKIVDVHPLADKNHKLKVNSAGNNHEIDLTGIKQEKYATVIVAEVSKNYKVYAAPGIEANYSVFIDTFRFALKSEVPGAVIRYTVDGSVPDNESSLSAAMNTISPGQSFTLKAACFINNELVSGISQEDFKKVTPVPSSKVSGALPGLRYAYFEGQMNNLADLASLNAVGNGICKQPDISIKKRASDFGFVFDGYLDIPVNGVFQIQLTSDDGSELTIGGKTLSNDGLHAMESKTLDVALEKGLHPVRIRFFQAGGGDGLELKWKTGESGFTFIPENAWGWR
jgi:alpha-L-fucosidase